MDLSQLPVLHDNQQYLVARWDWYTGMDAPPDSLSQPIGGDLQIYEGDIIVYTGDMGSGWAKGYKLDDEKKSEKGFPFNYIRQIKDSDLERKKTKREIGEQYLVAQRDWHTGMDVPPDFPSQPIGGDLQIYEGDIIVYTGDMGEESGWVKGYKLKDEKKSVKGFPFNYIIGEQYLGLLRAQRDWHTGMDVPLDFPSQPIGGDLQIYEGDFIVYTGNMGPGWATGYKLEDKKKSEKGFPFDYIRQIKPS